MVSQRRAIAILLCSILIHGSIVQAQQHRTSGQRSSLSDSVICSCGQVCIQAEQRCCPDCGRNVDSIPPSNNLAPVPPAAPSVPSTVQPFTPFSTPPSVPVAPSPTAPTPPTPPPGPTPPAPSLNDFSNFSPQSPVTTASVFAAAPAMISNNFGGGSSSAIVVDTQLLPAPAYGTIVSGTDGSATSDLSFDLMPPDFVPDFNSVGLGRDERGGGDGIDTFDVEEVVPGTAFTPQPGQTFDGATATLNTGTGPYTNNELWAITARFLRTVEIPNPSASVVGRLKIGENSSPMPRNRVFMNYSYFDDVPLRPGGVGVNRFSPGIEVMLDDDSSVELRTPFASTASSSFALDGATTTGVEFGDIFIVFKQLLAKTENTLWSAGLGVTAPTADGLDVSLVDGTKLIRVHNQTVHLQPFIGYMFLLTDRLFVQGFVQFDIDVRGNRVELNPTAMGNGLQAAGKIRDTTLLYNDISLGYWLRKQGEHRDSIISSIVPMLEVHTSNTLEANDTITLGQVTLGEAGNGVQNLTFVLGTHFGINNTDLLTFGYAQPAGNRSDQMFDGELRVFWNRYF